MQLQHYERLRQRLSRQTCLCWKRTPSPQRNAFVLSFTAVCALVLYISAHTWFFIIHNFNSMKNQSTSHKNLKSETSHLIVTKDGSAPLDHSHSQSNLNSLNGINGQRFLQETHNMDIYGSTIDVIGNLRKQDKFIQQREARNWGKQQYGDFLASKSNNDSNFGLCCIMSTMWHEQESWKISLKIWLNECDCILFFVDAIDTTSNDFKDIKIGDISGFTYKSLNLYVGTLEGEFKWVLPTNIDKPTLFIDDEIILQEIKDNHVRNPNAKQLSKQEKHSKLLHLLQDRYGRSKYSYFFKQNLDFNIQLSPFEINSQKSINIDNNNHDSNNNDRKTTKEFWIIPLNDFIINQLDSSKNDTSDYYWTNIDETIPKYGRLDVWDKTAAMLVYLYKYHQHECKWIVKMDSDSFVAIPTMKSFLSYYDPLVAHYLGSPQLWRLNSLGQPVAFQGGAYLVLSIRGLEYVIPELLTMKFNKNYSDFIRLQGRVQQIDKNKNENLNNSDIIKYEKFIKNNYQLYKKYDELMCVRGIGVGEDVMLGTCLRNVGIIAENTKDSLYRRRFLMSPNDETWKNWKNDLYFGKHKKLSPFPLGFHNLKIEQMGKQMYKQIIWQMYNETIMMNREIYKIWDKNRTKMFEDLLPWESRSFLFETWQHKNKLINITVFVNHVLNCHYCKPSYPRDVTYW